MDLKLSNSREDAENLINDLELIAQNYQKEQE